ncbi:hypothetical protein NDU88_010414 [Pleurodeles waltl]|uniref:Secreted protein n=1 Tax=Pleurodeles waltl TaxID=8319 RepID=A0AAV7QXC8_PLEWA|nr:hypothetical protein NDU88_010414 [Pleurodeles waltl]
MQVCLLWVTLPRHRRQTDGHEQREWPDWTCTVIPFVPPTVTLNPMHCDPPRPLAPGTVIATSICVVPSHWSRNNKEQQRLASWRRDQDSHESKCVDETANF